MIIMTIIIIIITTLGRSSR